MQHSTFQIGFTTRKGINGGQSGRFRLLQTVTKQSYKDCIEGCTEKTRNKGVREGQKYPVKRSILEENTPKKESHGDDFILGFHTPFTRCRVLYRPRRTTHFLAAEFFRVGDNARFSGKRYHRKFWWFIMCMCI